MQLRRCRSLAVLAALALVPAAGWGQGVVEPSALRPDAKLPDIKLNVDLGERNYNLADELKNADEVVRYYNKTPGLVNDAALQQRVETIERRIITAAMALGPKQVRTDKPKGPDDPGGMAFKVRILKSDEVNAFSAWGGNIYLTTGMIKFCQSDDELASILGHETAHSMFHHLREQVQKEQRYSIQELVAMAAGALMGINVGQLIGITQYVHLALMNGHSVTDEAQADYAGCYYTYRAGYNPVGMITSFERLHRQLMAEPHPEFLGAFQTHPWSDERAEAMEKQIRALGLPIDRRAVMRAVSAGVRTTPATEKVPEKVELLLGDTLLMQVSPVADRSAGDRAADAAYAINEALSRGLRASDLRLVQDGEGWVLQSLVRLHARPLLTVHPADAALNGKPGDVLARAVYQRFLARARQEEINNGAL